MCFTAYAGGEMGCIGAAAILIGIALLGFPLVGAKQVDFKEGPPLAWLWAIAFLASGLIALLGG